MYAKCCRSLCLWLLARDLFVRHLGDDFLRRPQDIGGAHSGKEVKRAGDETRPSSLMACSQARTVIAVKIFVKEDVVAPVRILLELLRCSVNRPLAVRIAQEDTRSAPSDLLSHFE